jgi:rhodanese-related sulfurtransferase
MTTVIDLQQLLASSSQLQLVDVRSAGEFACGHIPGAMNVPLDQLESRIGDLSSVALIVLVCQRGSRAASAATAIGDRRKTTVLEGGTSAWSDAGLPLVQTSKARWALERQVRLIAGLLVIGATLLGLLVDSRLYLFAAIVGAGQVFAAITDICPMGSLLLRMPWNKAGSCESQPTRTCCGT